MRLYQAMVLNTCPRRVTIYMAEKGIRCEVVTVDMRGGEGRSAQFLDKSPSGRVPVLELDDGTFLPESAAIVEYLEELHPTPPMLGVRPAERAQVRATERLASDFIIYQGMLLKHTDPEVPKRRPEIRQYPDVGKAVAATCEQLLEALERRIGANEFLAGDRPTIADCTFFAITDVSKRLSRWEIPAPYPHLRRWFERFRGRSSAQYP
jgi:glutathione S-transferase